MATVIFHIEIANFLATALEHQHAKLRGRPFVIAPLGADRARVYGASQVARSMGIHTGMLVRDVRRIDRSIIVNPMENKLFKDISERMVKTVANFSPVFEPWRYGNIYLEFLARKQAWERARDTAWRLKKEVKQQQYQCQPGKITALTALLVHGAAATGHRSAAVQLKIDVGARSDELLEQI